MAQCAMAVGGIAMHEQRSRPSLPAGGIDGRALVLAPGGMALIAVASETFSSTQEWRSRSCKLQVPESETDGCYRFHKKRNSVLDFFFGTLVLLMGFTACENSSGSAVFHTFSYCEGMIDTSTRKY